MLVRYDPFTEFDRMTDQLFGSNSARGMSRPHWMAMDAVRREHDIELRFDLPGVAPDSIDLTVERNVLSVKAERSWTPSEGEEILASERPTGAVTRQVMLGETLDLDQLNASYEHGVLTVVVPVAPQAKARKVEIRAAGNGGPEAIEA